MRNYMEVNARVVISELFWVKLFSCVVWLKSVEYAATQGGSFHEDYMNVLCEDILCIKGTYFTVVNV